MGLLSSRLCPWAPAVRPVLSNRKSNSKYDFLECEEQRVFSRGNLTMSMCFLSPAGRPDCGSGIPLIAQGYSPKSNMVTGIRQLQHRLSPPNWESYEFTLSSCPTCPGSPELSPPKRKHGTGWRGMWSLWCSQPGNPLSKAKETAHGIALPSLSFLFLLWQRTECMPFVSKEGSGHTKTQLPCKPEIFQVAEHWIMYSNPCLLTSVFERQKSACWCTWFTDHHTLWDWGVKANKHLGMKSPLLSMMIELCVVFLGSQGYALARTLLFTWPSSVQKCLSALCGFPLSLVCKSSPLAGDLRAAL